MDLLGVAGLISATVGAATLVYGVVRNRRTDTAAEQAATRAVAVVELEAAVSGLGATITRQDGEIARQGAEVTRQDGEIARLEVEIARLTAEVARLVVPR